MDQFRFIHAADIHLDSPLRSLALRDPALAELIGNATRRVFVRIVDLALKERVDALLIAGDLYDGDQTSMKTARFLAEQLRRLDQAGVASFIIRGNHDALSRITRELVLPPGVKVFGGRAEAIEVKRAPDRFPVVIHGLSFAQPQVAESLLPRYRPAVEGAANIGLLHTSLGGAPGHDVYAPCSLSELKATGFAYWALGHIHQRNVAAEGPQGVVMAGNPQGRDINEAGAKSVTLVTIGADRSVRMEERLTSIAEFRRVTLDVSTITEWPALADALGRALEAERTAVRSPHMVARIQLAGTTPLAWRMRRDLDLLKAEAEERASVIGGSWVEKLEVAAHAPDETASVPGDPLGELGRLMRDDILPSDAFRAQLGGIADELRKQLPPECRDILGTDAADAATLLDALAREGAQNVLARLRATEAAA